jgi:phage tail-like protein
MPAEATYPIVEPSVPGPSPESGLQDTEQLITTKLPTIYLDLASEVEDGDVSADILLVNRIPEPTESDVPIDTPLEIVANIINDDGLSDGTITITDKDGTTVAWTLGGGFHANYSASAHNSITSQGAGGADEFRWQLIRATNWESQDRVIVRVQLTPTTGSAIDETYFFDIEDVTVPELRSAETRGLKRLRLTFNEPVTMTATGNGALRVRDLSGRLTFVAPNNIEVEASSFPGDLTGDHVCISGAEESVNNRYFQVESSTQGTPNEIITVEDEVATEAPNVAHRLFSSPYRIIPIIDENRLFPAYTPCIIGAQRIDASTVELILDQALTPNHRYRVAAHNIGDAANPSNVRDVTTATFQSEKLPGLARRKFSLWDFVPQGNKRDDTSHDLERLVRILDEPIQLMLADTDNFERIYDIDTTPEEFVDALLLHLGNPYTFLRNDLEKRRVANHLVETYKVSGAEAAIEQSIEQILGYPADVKPLQFLEGQWILGEGELGIDSFLGPSDLFSIYSFEVDVSADALSSEETTIVREICETWRPAHTHCVRINAIGAP